MINQKIKQNIYPISGMILCFKIWNIVCNEDEYSKKNVASLLPDDDEDRENYKHVHKDCQGDVPEHKKNSLIKQYFQIHYQCFFLK